MFSDAVLFNVVNESSSNAESYNEDDMYGMDPSMIVMSNSSDDREYVNTSESCDIGEEEDISEDGEVSFNARSDDGEDGESFEGNENVSTYKSAGCI